MLLCLSRVVRETHGQGLGLFAVLQLTWQQPSPTSASRISGDYIHLAAVTLQLSWVTALLPLSFCSPTYFPFERGLDGLFRVIPKREAACALRPCEFGASGPRGHKVCIEEEFNQ